MKLSHPNIIVFPASNSLQLFGMLRGVVLKPCEYKLLMYSVYIAGAFWFEVESQILTSLWFSAPIVIASTEMNRKKNIDFIFRLFLHYKIYMPAMGASQPP